MQATKKTIEKWNISLPGIFSGLILLWLNGSIKVHLLTGLNTAGLVADAEVYKNRQLQFLNVIKPFIRLV